MSKTRLLGTVIPVGALRSGKPTAIGEFPDLGEFALLCKKMKVGLIQLLPVNDTGYESSPYFSLSAFALHPVYLRIGELPEAEQFKDKESKINRDFGGYARFPFQSVMHAKMDLLLEIYTAHESAIEEKARQGGGLHAWIEQNPWVREYAVYRRLKEANGGKSWKEWTEHRDVTAEDIMALWEDPRYRREHLFWVWLQEALDRQFHAAAKAVAEAGIILEGDLPILMNDDSCDVWAHREIFILELSAGAPPDMYSPEGQNWGFPLYNWAVQEKDNYAWWKQRLAVAGKYYQAYRIDHVLGFFRIWSSSHRDYSSILGRFIPFTPISNSDLQKLGYDKGRIRWISQPHVPTGELLEAFRTGPDQLSDADIDDAAKKVFSKALNQIGDEDLWLFRKKIKGEKDIDALGLHPSVRPYLIHAWHNRILLEYEKGKYFPVWYYRDTRAFQSLSDGEKTSLEELMYKRLAKSEKTWEAHGKKLLSILVESSSMLPCAEDLGAVPQCVPKVLSRLNILGLRVVRWHRRWDMDGQPFIPFEEYPELSVCTAAVHDSSTIREWWEGEADQEQFAGFIGFPSPPKTYDPDIAQAILAKAASARSRFRVFQIQDLLHLSAQWYAEDPASERINVPGTCNDFNWTYRLPASVSSIGKDKMLVKAVAALSKIKAARKQKDPVTPQ
ncbi:MAG: 4-alpha-glucanotransferase [Treponema sp.]|nr:4-alpha-glucanotransferase [Treponema sp.]MCL2269871.1 4-alpha-glucanotransferase [Treponema sp.]